MAATAFGPPQASLLISGRGDESRQVELDGKPYRVGRASANELSFPDNAALSREHLLFERSGESWVVQDLNSRNGTMLNGRRITGTVAMSNWDVIAAGNLSFTFIDNQSTQRPNDRTVILFDGGGEKNAATQTVAINLKSALASEAPARVESTDRAHLSAFVRAGRELVSHRPMDELFQAILDIAVDTVHATRGMVATRGGNGIEMRAQCGSGFRISSAVVDRVLEKKESLLILDASGVFELAQRESIVASNVKSILAVPLQTDELAIGLIYLDSPNQAVPFTPEDLNFLTVMANIAAVRIENSRLLQIEHQEKLRARDMEQAALIQRSLLPGSGPAIQGYELAGYNAPSRSVGGDYYDFLKFEDGQVGVLVADVAGKGMPAALLMSGLHARVQVLFDRVDDLAGRVQQLNKSLAKSFPMDRFVTFFMAVLSPESGLISFCSAGHNPPLLVRSGKPAERLEATGCVLGISPHFAFEDGHCEMESGDVLALFSDGVTEAADPHTEEEFGEERLLDVLQEHRSESATAIVRAIRDAVAAFTQGSPLADDLTLAIVRRL